MTVDSGSPPPLAHLAYLEALAHAADSGDRWRALSAGYAALQLVEVWAGCDGGTVTLSEIELRRVRKRIGDVRDGDPIRRCLEQLVDVVDRAPLRAGSHDLRPSGYEVGRILAAYGKLLQYEASWSLARDVYETLITYASCIDDEERLLDSMLMVGFSLRMLGQLDAARESYGRLRARAAEAESEQYLLLSELGLAKIAIERGNLPAAVGMLDQLITETGAAEHVAIRAKALMDRARVADQLGDLAAAAMLSHQAYECSTDPMERERILINIGMTLMQLGLWEQARDANVILSATAQEATVRWMAQINLMELAWLEQREPTFEQLRRAVAELELPPYLEAVYHETCALGFRAFGKRNDSRVALQRLLRVAERHGLNEFVVKAERELRGAGAVGASQRPSRRSSVAEQPPEIAAVAHAVTELRILAGL